MLSASNNCTAGQLNCRLLQRTLVKQFAIARDHFVAIRNFGDGEFGIERSGHTFGVGVFFRAHDECHIARAPEDL